MNSKVTLDCQGSGPKIDAKIFGHFLENMARSIYSGGLLDIKGRVREEIVKAFEDVNMSVLRWPGGLFADGYDWKDGVGQNRPTLPNKFWKKLSPLIGPKDFNYFGTDEFLGMCQRIKADPYINVNIATGTAENAADWVEYCNGNPETTLGGERAKNGKMEPWAVKIWGIGNEQFGWWALGHNDPEAYGKKYLEFYDAMTDRDEWISPVAVGACDLFPDWNDRLLQVIGDRAAYLSVHVYLPGNQPPFLFMGMPPNAKNHYSLASAGFEVDRKLKIVAEQIRKNDGPDSKMKVALDEWNLWWWWPQVYKVRWRMRDAVSVASMAGAMVNNCETVGMGNLAQAVNVLGLLLTNYDHVVKTPLFYVMKMFAEALKGSRVDVKVDAPTYSSKKAGGIPATTDSPLVEAFASRNGDDVGMIIVQKRYEQGMNVEIEAPDFKFERLQVLSGVTPDAKNTYSNPDNVGVSETEIKDGQGGLVVSLPPASVAAVYGKCCKC